MPVRLLNSSVLKWPDKDIVVDALIQWTEKNRNRENLLAVGYFGSYARGDWGVGSDLDMIILLNQSENPYERRALEWDVNEIPVPVDLLIYTQQEWQQLMQQNTRFAIEMSEQVIWVYQQKAN